VSFEEIAAFYILKTAGERILWNILGRDGAEILFPAFCLQKKQLISHLS
jgi:hypothetical protein